MSHRAPGILILRRTYLNAEYLSFAHIVQSFLKEANVAKPPITACFAVAGPVKNNLVKFTNREAWVIDGEEIARVFNIRVVKLVNDFLAAGYGVSRIKLSDCTKLNHSDKAVL